MNITKITAYEAKTKQAEIFRRAAAGEQFIVTNNNKPQVEIHQFTPPRADIRSAIKALTTLQKQKLTSVKGGSQQSLKTLLDEGRD